MIRAFGTKGLILAIVQVLCVSCNQQLVGHTPLPTQPQYGAFEIAEGYFLSFTEGGLEAICWEESETQLPPIRVDTLAQMAPAFHSNLVLDTIIPMRSGFWCPVRRMMNPLEFIAFTSVKMKLFFFAFDLKDLNGGFRAEVFDLTVDEHHEYDFSPFKQYCPVPNRFHNRVTPFIYISQDYVIVKAGSNCGTAVVVFSAETGRPILEEKYDRVNAPWLQQ